MKKKAAERVKILEELVATISRSKKMWEATFDVISDPVLIIDSHYTITRANKALAKACDEDVRHVIGKKCYEIFAGYQHPCPKCPVITAGKNAGAQVAGANSGELDMFDNKRQYHASAYSFPNLSHDNEATVIHYRDVTDEKRLHKKLMHSEKMAAVGTLAGGVAHEINNPLGGILAFAQLIMRQLDENHACQSDLKEIENAVLRCKKIVRDLLDFSRRNIEEEMNPVQINDLIRQTMTLIQINARHLNVTIVQELAPDLPLIYGHFGKLQQVLLNLVTNALHAMKAKGGTLTVKTSTNPEKNIVFLKVQDTGMGIDDGHVEKIFDPYFTTKAQGEGTGLGLSISYKIIEEHGGKIDVSSQKNSGTTMTLQFSVNKNVASSFYLEQASTLSH
jgi:two-component system NtrC family sensor kinase